MMNFVTTIFYTNQRSKPDSQFFSDPAKQISIRRIRILNTDYTMHEHNTEDAANSQVRNVYFKKDTGNATVNLLFKYRYLSARYLGIIPVIRQRKESLSKFLVRWQHISTTWWLPWSRAASPSFSQHSLSSRLCQNEFCISVVGAEAARNLGARLRFHRLLSEIYQAQNLNVYCFNLFIVLLP